MARRTTVLLNPVAMQKLFVRGGDVYKFASDVVDDTRTAARRLAPRRTGELKRSMGAERHTLPLGVSFRAFNYAGHALFVEEGTRGPITAHRGWMVLYQQPRYIPARRHIMLADRVKGQRARHYLRDGLAVAMAKHGLV